MLLQIVGQSVHRGRHFVAQPYFRWVMQRTTLYATQGCLFSMDSLGEFGQRSFHPVVVFKALKVTLIEIAVSRFG
ncbi:hypothetical protein AMK20_27245 [Streptomyces sp. TSRI0261]|nr:hypothetical protein AMK20_27245 [Streptomyces sp. TSRI0261]